jgi:hypothetical protein
LVTALERRAGETEFWFHKNEMYISLDGVEVSANVAESVFATTEGIAVNGRRAIDRAADYEMGVRNIYGDLPMSQRRFSVVVDDTELSGVADSTTAMNGKLTAVEAKYVDDWLTSLRNPASEIGREPWAADEQRKIYSRPKHTLKTFPVPLYIILTASTWPPITRTFSENPASEALAS